jgi:hypothetical protein
MIGSESLVNLKDSNSDTHKNGNRRNEIEKRERDEVC